MSFCIAESNTLRTCSHIVYISILVPIVPPQFTNSLPSIKTIKEGETLTLDFAASGTPTPNITWVQILNSSNIIISEGEGSATLNIPNIQRPSGLSGKYIYKCRGGFRGGGLGG